MGRLAAVTLVAIALAGPIGGCGERDPLAPPPLYYGEDVCAVCGMIISDERFAAAAITRAGEGSASALFDDVGCLLAYEEDVGESAVLARYVRGFRTPTWIEMRDGVFVHSRQLKTPMAFGVAACATAETADAVRRDYPGDVLDLAALRIRFRGGDLTVIPD